MEEVAAAKEISAASGFFKKKKRGTDGFKTAEKIHKVARVVPFGYLIFFCCFLKSNNNAAVETLRPLTREVGGAVKVTSPPSRAATAATITFVVD